MRSPVDNSAPTRLMRDLVGLAFHNADRAYLGVQRGRGCVRPSGQEERGRPKARPPGARVDKTSLPWPWSPNRILSA